MLQLQGAGVAPFFINKQNLFMKALFEPLSALCSVSTAELTQVRAILLADYVDKGVVLVHICSPQAESCDASRLPLFAGERDEWSPE